MASVRSLWLGVAVLMVAIVPAASEPSGGSDREKLIGVWRLVEITLDGKVNPLRGGKPIGYIFYTASGEMGAMIQPERAPIPMKGKSPSGEEAQAALLGFTAYWGTYSIDEKAKIVTHHRKASVQPGYETDARRNYRFEPGDRLILGGVGTKNAIVWERVK